MEANNSMHCLQLKNIRNTKIIKTSKCNNFALDQFVGPIFNNLTSLTLITLHPLAYSYALMCSYR